MSTALANLERARQALAKARTLPEIKRIRNMAEAARTYAKAAHLSRESQNFAAEISLRASRKAGEILKQLQKSPGTRPDKQPAANVAEGSEYAKTLKETNTPDRTARYWQRLADIPENRVTEYLEQARQNQQEISTSAFLKWNPSPGPHEERRKNRNDPANDFENVRELALRMVYLGHKAIRDSDEEMRKIKGDHSLLDSAKTWAQRRLKGKPEYDTEHRDYPVSTPCS